MADQSQASLQQHCQALQRLLGEASTSLRCSGQAIAATTGQFLTAMQQNHTFFQPRSQPFAAVNLPFARSADVESGSKRKKKRIPRPEERLQQRQEEEDEESPAPENKSVAKRAPKAKPTKQPKGEATPKAVIDGDDKDTPAAVRALSNVREPLPANDEEAAPIAIALLQERLNEAEKAELNNSLWARIARHVKARVGHREMSVRRLAREAKHDLDVKGISADEPTLRHRLREEVMDELPGSTTRPEAPKMQLQPFEQDALELERLGEGHLFSPHKFLGHSFGGLHDFAWGIFGRSTMARRVLEDTWAGKNPDEVLAQQEFYDDIMDGANKMELTVMMVAERPIPLKQLREKFLERQIKILSLLPEGSDDVEKARISNAHALALARIKRNVTVDAFSRSGLIDSKGRIVPDSKLILSIGPFWQLTAEAITAGRIKDQRTVFLGRWEDKAFAQGLLENFLGLPPVDPAGKTSVGNSMLYVANGFNFEAPEKSGNPNQFYNEDDGLRAPPASSVAFEGILAPPESFTMTGQQPASLLTGIRRLKASR